VTSAEGSGKKKIPLSFEDFYESLTRLIAKAIETRKMGSILPFLKQKVGFALNESQIWAVLEQIGRLPNPDIIEFFIVLEYRLNRSPSRSILAIGSEISRQYFQRTHFSELIANARSQSPSLPQIESWIRRSMAGYGREINQYPRPIASVHKEIFGCLLTQIDSPNFVASVMSLLEIYLGIAGQYQSDEKKSVRNFANSIAALLKQGKSAKSRIALMIETRQILAAELQQVRRFLRNVEEKSFDLEETSKQQSAELNEKQKQLESAEGTIAELQKRIKEQEDELELANTRAAAIENHFNEIHRQEVNGMIFKLRQQIDNELNEIRYCLEGNNPNVSMALGRITRLLETAKNLKGL
jgi:hypothetical protein